MILEEHGRSYLGDSFSQILLEDITYLSEDDIPEEATVSYRVQAATTFTLPSGSPYTPHHGDRAPYVNFYTDKPL